MRQDPTAVKPIALKNDLMGSSDITGEGVCSVLCVRDGGCTELRPQFVLDKHIKSPSASKYETLTNVRHLRGYTTP
jgi:hypothetical protein